MKPQYGVEKTTWHFVHEVLRQAQSIHREELVAKHLIRAHLSIVASHGSHSVGFDSSNGSDNLGGFQVRKLIFFVSLVPEPSVLALCKKCAVRGLGVRLLVPDRAMADYRRLADSVMPGRITVFSIEDFLSLSIDLRATGCIEEIPASIRSLLEVYNECVDRMETDKSLLIEIPRNLLD